MTNVNSRLSQPNMQAELDEVEEAEENKPELAELELVTATKTPWLQEVVMTSTKFLILAVTLIVILLSINAKAGLWLVLLRGSVSILVMGFLGYMVNWFFGRYLVEAKVAELREKVEAEDALEAERLAKEQAELENLELLQQQEYEDNHPEIES